MSDTQTSTIQQACEANRETARWLSEALGVFGVHVYSCGTMLDGTARESMWVALRPEPDSIPLVVSCDAGLPDWATLLAACQARLECGDAKAMEVVPA